MILTHGLEEEEREINSNHKFKTILTWKINKKERKKTTVIYKQHTWLYPHKRIQSGDRVLIEYIISK